MRGKSGAARGKAKTDRFLGPVEAARLLGLGPTTLVRWIDAGAIPAHRTLGRHRRIREGDLRAFAERRGIPLGAEHGLLSRRILLLDDDPALRRMIRARIEALRPDVEISVAENALEGGLAIAALRPAVVLVDLRMAGLAPRLLPRRARAAVAPDEIRVIGLVRVRGYRDRRILRAAGYDEVLVRPVASAELQRTLWRLLPPVPRPPRRLSAQRKKGDA